MNNYLAYVRKSSESPERYHVWSALAGAGALSVRKTWLDLGSVRHYPNQYIVLVGPTASRKSSAMKIMKHLIKESGTYVKYSPTDTAGARQGLLAALKGDVSYGDSDEALSAEFSEAALMNVDMSAIDNKVSELFVYSSQFSSFLGQKQFDLLQCLSYCYDNPDEYTYKLKQTEEYVYKPTMSVLAACSPENLYSCLPNNAAGMKFIARCMLVYGAKGERKLPRPQALSKEFAEKHLLENIRFCREHTGPFKETEGAQKALDAMYQVEPRMNDSRFLDYASLRFAHLCKAVMNFALIDGRDTITVNDVNDARILMEETEELMTHALGEYGLNPISLAKQRIMEIINALDEDSFMTDDEIYNLINRDVPLRDFNAALRELHVTERIVRIQGQTADGTRNMFKYMAIQRLSQAERDKLLENGKTDWKALLGDSSETNH